jgi:hypothetical protein
MSEGNGSTAANTEPCARTFVVHHNPTHGRYRYPTDPNDAVASARALLDAGEGGWVAGNCRKMIRAGDLLLFKFGGSRLLQKPGLYVAAQVTRAPAQDSHGTWRLRFAPDVALTKRLLASPIVGEDLSRVVGRSFGASIQAVTPKGQAFLARRLGEAPRRAAAPPPLPPASPPSPAPSRSVRARALPSPLPGASITRGLVVMKDPLDKILAGTKTWEIRGKSTAIRGPIALIESGSGQVVGTCELVDVVGPLSLAELQKNSRRAGFRPSQLWYDTTHAWVVRDARRLSKAVPYRHPVGAVIWVRLEPKVMQQLERAATEGAFEPR